MYGEARSPAGTGPAAAAVGWSRATHRDTKTNDTRIITQLRTTRTLRRDLGGPMKTGSCIRQNFYRFEAVPRSDHDSTKISAQRLGILDVEELQADAALVVAHDARAQPAEMDL